MVRQLRAIEYECAQATGNVETAARLLIEMMAPGSGVEAEDRSGLPEDFTSLLTTTAPATSEPIVIDVGDDAILEARAGFRSAQSQVGGAVPFQVVIDSPTGVDISRLEFTALRIACSDARGDIVVTAAGESRAVNVGTIDTGLAEHPVEAALKWVPGRPLVVTGELVGELGELCVADVTLTLTQGPWTFDLRLTPRRLLLWTTNGQSFTPLGGIHSVVSFAPRAHSVALEVVHAPAAFVGEALPLTLKVTAAEACDANLALSLSVLLQPGAEPDGATVSLDDESTESMLKEHHLQLVDGAAETVLYLVSPRAGTKMVDISIAVTRPDDEADDEHTVSVAEVAKTAVVPVLSPFSSTPTLSRAGATASLATVLSVPGPRGVFVSALEIVPAAEGVTLSSSSLPSTISPAQRWDHMTAYSLAARFKLDAGAQRTTPPGPVAHLKATWRPADTADETEHTALIALPALQAVPPEPFLTATLASPAVVRSHEAFSATLSLANAHPSSAAYVAVHGDTADGFVWSGPRGARVGPVPANGNLDVRIDAVAVGGAGWLALPHLSVSHGEGADKREVRVQQPADRAAWTVLVQP